MIDPKLVAQAYAGIEADEDGIDLGVVFSEMVESEGERLLFVSLSASEFEKITRRILELMEIVRQNALVADPPPDNDWIDTDPDAAGEA